MEKTSPKPPCPVCSAPQPKIHCASPTCVWYRCSKSSCGTIYDKARRYIRNLAPA